MMRVELVVPLIASLWLSACSPPATNDKAESNTKQTSAAIWKFGDARDRLTGKKFHVAVMTLPIEGGGNAELQAECWTNATVFLDIELRTDDDGFLNVDTRNDEFRLVDSSNREQLIYRHTPHEYEVSFYVKKPLNGETNPGTSESLESQTPPFYDMKVPQKIEVPLVDGRKAILELHPEEKGLQELISRCSKEH